jgi:ATP-binding cassette subfamily F protein 3
MFLNKVHSLSGGERARLAILRLLLQPYNLLLLDEPTNHMDMDSKMAIESAINTYTGTVIAVSHDRRFLDMIADVIFFMDEASIKMYTGNYTSFRLQRQKELTNISDKNLAYLSSSGLKRYVVRKAFTVWATRTKHKVGEEIFIGEHNEEIYEWAINSKILEPADNPKKR